jgi:K(+)-stimulated pyrophosphate-energized sodium pump
MPHPFVFQTEILWVLMPIGSAMALVFAWLFYQAMLKAPEGTDRMKEIAAYVREGAYAYLKRQYSVVTIVFIVLSAIFAFLAFVLHVQNRFVWFSFLTGGFFSGLAGFIGMRTATFASARTANGCRTSLNSGLKIAFRSGAVMGLTVVGLALLDITIWYLVLERVYKADLVTITTTLLTFGMGASTQALFARVGGGIFTKAADVGADLVGKVEAGIPEDDPRNPATIADNVGDNVGDVAGMGADLYESYAGSILATATLGAAVVGYVYKGMTIDTQTWVIAPMIVAGLGVIFSCLATLLVRTGEDATQRELLKALARGVNAATLLTAIGSYFVIRYLGLPLGVWGSVIAGLLAGWLIGKITEYFTSDEYQPTRDIAAQAQTGPATVIIGGMATGMLSSGAPVVVISLGILFAFGLAGGFADVAVGLYGVGISAVGMLATLGITLATDAYGPIADNAGGNAEMAQLEPEVRQRTDALDSLGNTTAATGKGFAIGSAALTALALLASYVEEIKLYLSKAVEAGHLLPGVDFNAFGTGDLVANIRHADITQLVEAYNVTLMNPLVLVGIFLGAAASFVFCALTMRAVGNAAGAMVEEVRRQFREKPGIMKGEDTPDYARCVYISTRGAQRAMMLPAFLAIGIPVVIGLFFGVPGVMGLLAGALSSGFILAIFMANAGGAWDNAKKFIEKGNFGGKWLPDGTKNPIHGAAVIGDTVGDPFKDTSGPSLNILIKLMSMISVVVAGVTVTYSGVIQKLLGILMH